MENFVEGVPQTPMSTQTQGIHATSPDTSIDLYDNAAPEFSPHGAASSLARRATQEGVGVSVPVHGYLVLEVMHLRESSLTCRLLWISLWSEETTLGDPRPSAARL